MLNELWQCLTMTAKQVCLNPCFNGICSMSDSRFGGFVTNKEVLILVLMEYAQWDMRNTIFAALCFGLNPCFNGICSMRPVKKSLTMKATLRLNPCFNGICSMSRCQDWRPSIHWGVLILVLMEYAQWDLSDNG